jgi:hypothetical protein
MICVLTRWTIMSLLLPLAAMLPSSCTICMWSQDGMTFPVPSSNPWPPARIAYHRIEAAAVGSNGWLHLRIARSRGEPIVCMAPLTGLWRAPRQPEAVTIEDLDARNPQVVAQPARDLPPANRPVRIVERGGTDTHLARADASPSSDPRAIVLELEGLHVPAASPSRPGVRLEIALPDPTLDWWSLDVMGHVAATPVFVAFDVVMPPAYGLFALVRLVPTH